MSADLSLLQSAVSIWSFERFRNIVVQYNTVLFHCDVKTLEHICELYSRSKKCSQVSLFLFLLSIKQQTDS